MGFQYRLPHVQHQSAVDVHPHGPEALRERERRGEESPELDHVRDWIRIPRGHDEGRPTPTFAEGVTPVDVGDDAEGGSFARLRPERVPPPEEFHTLLPPPPRTADHHRLLADAEHRVRAHPEGPDLRLVRVSLGDLAQAAPVLRSEGVTVVAVGHPGHEGRGSPNPAASDGRRQR